MTYPATMHRQTGWSAGLTCLTLALIFTISAPSKARAVACSVSNAQMLFGAYKPTDAAAKQVTGAIDVRCTCSGTLDCVLFGYKVEVQAGSGGSVTNRSMTRTGGGGTLKYSLYRDALRTANFGEGTSGQSMIYLAALFGSYQRVDVFGAIPAGQNVASGTYSDSPVVVITY